MASYSECARDLRDMRERLARSQANIIELVYPNAGRSESRGTLEDSIKAVIGDLTYLGKLVEQAALEYAPNEKKAPAKQAQVKQAAQVAKKDASKVAAKASKQAVKVVDAPAETANREGKK